MTGLFDRRGASGLPGSAAILKSRKMAPESVTFVTLGALREGTGSDGEPPSAPFSCLAACISRQFGADHRPCDVLALDAHGPDLAAELILEGAAHLHIAAAQQVAEPQRRLDP